MNLRIAIVDDDASILDALELVLQQYGWSVKTYSTAKGFLADLSVIDYDCVVLDPHLPGENSEAVARALAFKHIPTIGLTAQPFSRNANAVKLAGACPLLTKPVAADVIVGEIYRAVSAGKNVNTMTINGHRSEIITGNHHCTQ